MTFLHPKKLLLSKWTAIKPVGRQKHFLVTKVIDPEVDGGKIEWVELEAIMSRKTRRILWRELQDSQVWQQGWR
jgi:tryptophan-rich hypothetical protein